MRIHKDYYLFIRTLKSGRKAWYYRIYRDDGARSVPHSTGVEYTGKVSRIRAEKVCNELMVSGRLDGFASRTFALYSVGWFEEGRCAWLSDRQASGIPGRPGISPAYISLLKMCLRLYLLPYFGSTRLDELKPSKIKAFRGWMQKEKGLSNRTINVACDTLRIMTDWMIADRILQFDPFLSVKRFEIEKRARRGFTIEESRAIFEAKWASELARLFNLTAAITGMRLSEIRAIRSETLRPGYIDVIDQYNRDTLAPLKTKEARKVPIPTRLYEVLKTLAEQKPFAFSISGSKAPMSRNAAIEPLDKVIPKAEGEKIVKGQVVKAMVPKDGLCFHSWRHFANTWLLSEGVPPHVVRAIMGHSEGRGAMTSLYTDWTPSMFTQAYLAQEKLYGILEK